MSRTFDLAETFVSLARDGRTLPLEVDDDFWPNLTSGRIGAPGRLLSLFAFDGAWDSWEVHPNGDEIVLLLEGAAKMTLERDGKTEVVELATPGRFVLIERGTWHTARAEGPTRMLFVTDGEGTQHRPA